MTRRVVLDRLSLLQVWTKLLFRKVCIRLQLIFTLCLTDLPAFKASPCLVHGLLLPLGLIYLCCCQWDCEYGPRGCEEPCAFSQEVCSFLLRKDLCWCQRWVAWPSQAVILRGHSRCCRVRRGSPKAMLVMSGQETCSISTSSQT